MSVVDWSASASGEKGTRSEMAWLSDSRDRVVPGPSRVDLDRRSDQALMERHSRVKMNIIAKSEKIAVRLQKICTLSPGRCGAAAWAYSPVQVLGPAFVAAGEAQQLSPRIW
jgi:hypothetical protein